MLKKLISLNLVLVMMISLFPLQAFATDGVQQDSVQVVSNTIEKLPTPTGLYWDGISMKWDGMMEPIPNLKEYEFKYYYSLDRDGANLIEIDAEYWYTRWTVSHVDLRTLSVGIVEKYGDGYYYFKVRGITNDATKSLNGDWSELSPPCYYTLPEKLPTLTELSWDGEMTIWAEIGDTIPAAGWCETIVYWGDSPDTAREDLIVSGRITSSLNNGVIRGSTSLGMLAQHGSGYYRFSVRLLTNDITIALDGMESPLSPVYYYDYEEAPKLSSPTSLRWEGASMRWDSSQSSETDSYSLEIYYGTSTNLPIESLELAYDNIGVLADNWPALCEEYVNNTGAGYYYFRVKANPIGSNFSSSNWSELSPSYYYDGTVGPKLPAPTELCWNGTTMSWKELKDNTYSGKDVRFILSYYYGTKEDGSDATWLPIVDHAYDPGLETSIKFPVDLLNNYDLDDGYCFFRVKVKSDNIELATSSDFSELSPAYRYEKKYLIVDGVEYDAMQNHSGDGWNYTCFAFGSGSVYTGLTLTNYFGGAISLEGDYVHITLNGTNQITAEGTPGIHVIGDATISCDDGSLRVNGNGNAAIKCTGNLRINSGYNSDNIATILLLSGEPNCSAIDADRGFSTWEYIKTGSTEDNLQPVSSYTDEEAVEITNCLSVAGAQEIPQGNDSEYGMFLAWREVVDGQRRWYLPGDPISNLENSILFPQYVPSPGLSTGIILDGNGGQMANGSNYHVTLASHSDLYLYKLGDGFYKLPDVFLKKDASLKEYNTAADGTGKSYSIGDRIEVDENNPIRHLYAIWENTNSTPTSPDIPVIITPTVPSTTITETVRNDDGSTTTTVTNKATGTVIATTTYPNGAQTKTTTDTQGNNTTEIKVPSGITAEVVIPSENVTPGTVAMIINADGTTEIVPNCIPTENGIVMQVDSNVTLTIINNAKLYDDVADGDWYKDAVDFVSARGIMNGTGVDTFGSSEDTTRAMIWTMLARLNGADTTNGETWYAKGQEWATTSGVSDGTDPNAAITREQLAVMLWRQAGSPAVNDAELSALSDYADEEHISGYAQQAMAWAISNGIINGMGDGILNPSGNATRAHVSQILMNYMMNI